MYHKQLISLKTYVLIFGKIFEVVRSKSITVNNQKILLLDDNKDLLQIVQIILKGQGYETVLACCIEEASQKIKIHKPALILMDVFISDQDGRELCNQLKHDPDTSNIRIIMMSGYDNNSGAMA